MDKEDAFKNADSEEKCPQCGSQLEPIYDNNGFERPDPDKIEQVGVVCPACGYKD